LFLKLKSLAYKKRLKDYYKKISTSPDFNVDYLIFNIHYQPEATTSPQGDIFVDQSLCVNMLLKFLPVNYYIYVKEHPSQFHAHREGHTARTKDFYDDLNKNPRVRFMPVNYNPFRLMKQSKGVVTIRGTSGWEGMALGKPVIMFGSMWYEKYQGVLKITDEKSASGIKAFIENFVFDERNLFAYLAAVSKKSVKAYYYRGLKEKLNMSEEECVNNLANSIVEIVCIGSNL